LAVPQDVSNETGAIYNDVELERELRLAMKTEPEIDLFKTINKAMRIKDELANNESVKALLQSMWRNVEDFYALIIEADNIIGLEPSHDLVVAHLDMKANFRAVAAINMVFKDSEAAEIALVATDQMTREQEDLE